MRIIAMGILALAVASGCTSQTSQTTPNESINPGPEQMVLYSIDGRDFPKSKDGPADKDVSVVNEWLHQYPVLGKVEIKDGKQRKEILEALKDGIARKPEYGAKCFNPRHGLQFVEKGKTYEYIICFECSWYRLISEGSDQALTAINSDVQPKFDKVLKDAGVE
jgi:hypothetical protein